MAKYELIIEKSGQQFVGRIMLKDDLIVSEGNTVNKLENKMKSLLKEFYDVDPSDVRLIHRYDLTALFDVLSFLKISSIAEQAGINSSLLRQYVTGKKHPSPKQTQKIEEALHHIGNELRTIKLS